MTKLPIPFDNPMTYPGHSGVDFPKPAGTAFRASDSGVVTWLGWNSRGGYFIWVKYDNIGPKVGYHHMPSHAACPREGTRFKAGDQLGVVGNTGNSTGPHLHSEVEGYATTDGYWRFFDRNRVVGGAEYPARELYGEAWVKSAQSKLIRLGYDLGSWGADGKDGASTQAATKDLQRRGGLTQDGIFGPSTNSYADKLLNQGHPVFPLPSGRYFGPEGGPVESVSGHHGYAADLKRWQQRMKDRGWAITPDGLYGFQGSTSTDTQTGSIAKQFQAEKGLTVDGLIGPSTWDAAWTAPVTPAPTDPTPKPDPKPSDGTEADFTPKLVTPKATDYPAWVRYEEALDPDGQKANLNKDAAAYYGGKKYDPIESHTHWWGEPGKAGTHDGNVNYIRNAKDLSVNFVVSENRVTMMVPLNKIALTTGARNPFAWKSENDPTLTEQQYVTMGFLHYLVEKLNPSLRGEPIRLHKEFYATSCSAIDVKKVRAYADKFTSGALDPATGRPPVAPNPDPAPDSVPVERSTLQSWFDKLKQLLGGS